MTSVFDAYARYYDLMYGEKSYAAEAQYVAEQLRRCSGEVNRILELGCGTGGHAEHLARLGFSVHGVDMSKEMIGRATLRQESLPPSIAARLSFSEGDIRTYRTSHEYDAVIALFHVMSYQVANDDLEATFETAAAHVRGDGAFFFDFWFGPAVLTESPEVRVKRLEDENVRVIRIAQPIMHATKNTVDVNYTVLVTDKLSKRLEEISEKHTMRYLFLPEIEHYASSRFALSTANAWMTNRLPEKGDWSACVCMKRQV